MYKELGIQLFVEQGWPQHPDIISLGVQRQEERTLIVSWLRDVGISTSTVEMAIETVGKTAYGLRWSNPWVKTYPTDSATSSKVIELTHTLFVQFGIPEVVVTDNGPYFVSQESS